MPVLEQCLECKKADGEILSQCPIPGCREFSCAGDCANEHQLKHYAQERNMTPDEYAEFLHSDRNGFVKIRTPLILIPGGKI